jgi:glycosyltransferase involved in cell wall biosynthesis
VNIALDIRKRAGFGISTYIRNTVHALAEVDTAAEHRYILIGLPEQLRELRPLPDNFVLQPFPKHASSLRSAAGFYRLLKQHQCDLLHVPHLFKTPRFAPCPYVVTVHDVLDFIYLRSRQTERQSRMRVQLAKIALRRAKAIVAVSESTREDIARIFGIADVDRISVSYNAVDPKLTATVTEADRSTVRERYQIQYPFLLYAGSAKPHKNVNRLIEAFSALKTELAKSGCGADLKLIVIGDDISENPELRRTVFRSGVQQEVRFLGFVPIDALRVLYAMAEVFVFPSLYEGFGLPPLEAMSQGAPVVTSNTSALPEVVGDAAVLVNPENSFEMMRAIERVLCDADLRETLRSRGRERAKEFSWRRSAERLLSVYSRSAAQR